MKTLQHFIKKFAITAAVRCGRIGAAAVIGGLAMMHFSNATEAVHDYANMAYSNVRFIKSENDLVGWRIQIVSSANQTYVLVQSFEGIPQPPCLAKAKLDAIGAIQFDLSPTCEIRGRFEGNIQKRGLVGKFLNGMKGPDGETVMVLKRIPIK